MTSSLRNSLHRRNHKERSQLSHRTKLGILEKHKDYVLRARDYHSKQDRLNRLRHKAAERNKDEFYFSMVREKTRKGVHIKDRGNTALPVDIVKVLKTQDENYVRTMRTSNAKKIDNIKHRLTAMVDLVKDPLNEQDQSLGEDELKILHEGGILPSPSKALRKGKASHIIFADSAEETRQFAKESREARASTDKLPSRGVPEMSQLDLGWKPDLSKQKRRKPMHPPSVSASQDIESGSEGDVEADDLDSPENNLESSTSMKHQLLKELSARLRRDIQLRYAQREFEMQRLLMGKGARSKIAGVEKISGTTNSDEDEDVIDARKGRLKKSATKVDEEMYKPRVYKWKMERKK